MDCERQALKTLSLIDLALECEEGTLDSLSGICLNSPPPPIFLVAPEQSIVLRIAMVFIPILKITRLQTTVLAMKRY